MIMLLSCFVLSIITSCHSLLPEQSVTPLSDTSERKIVTPLSDYRSGVADVVEEWDFITRSPHKVIGTLIRASSKMHETERNVIDLAQRDEVVYSSDENTEKEELFVREEAVKEELHDSLGSFKHGKEAVHPCKDNLKLKTFSVQRPTKCNSSACSVLSTTSTTAPSFATSTSTVIPLVFMNNKSLTTTLKNIETTSWGTESCLQVIDFLQLLNALALWSVPTGSEAINARHSLLINTTGSGNEIELFDETAVDSVTINVGKIPDTSFSKDSEKDYIARSSIGMEVKAGFKDAGLEDSAIVGKESTDGEVENFKLDPQVIPRSKFAKSGGKEQAPNMVRSYEEGNVGVSEVDTGKKNGPGYETADESKSWESLGQKTNEKYDQTHRMNSGTAIMGYVEKTLWEKLVAGLKCSQRDCGDAMRPTESVHRYVMEPSISRARKHSNGWAE